MIENITISAIREDYRSGRMTPTMLVEMLLERNAHYADYAIWITPPDVKRLHNRAKTLEGAGMQDLPLYGIPFAIKDNIDVAGMNTTCACPAYAYRPEQSATVVARLEDAGAIAMGKTNLDQFATGLNGTRSPYGACRNAFNPEYISGGSSSGSAVAVALGLATFSLGTDTAGSGRVPAALNNLIGLKPTRGIISTHGVVPACKTLDVVSIFALSATDAQRVLAVAAAKDVLDPYSRLLDAYSFDFGQSKSFRFGIPMDKDLAFFGDSDSARIFREGVSRLESLGGEAFPIDFEPFLDTARLLYGGPWVAERYQAIRNFVGTQPEDLYPVTRDIILDGARPLAADAFAAFYRLRELQQVCSAVWETVDCIVTPTVGTTYTRAEMLSNPVRLNSELGYYTNFMNLLDYAAIAVPGGFRRDGQPLGLTFFAPAHSDIPLLHLAERWQASLSLPLRLKEVGTTGPVIDASIAAHNAKVRVAVVGAHLSGLRLNHQLTSLGARLVANTRTAPTYKLFALPDGLRPGLIRVADGGASIECEIWELSTTNFGRLVAAVSSPLSIGNVILEDKSSVLGFLCETCAIEGCTEITNFGGWRSYQSVQSSIN